MDMRAVTLKQKQQLIGLLEIACEQLELSPSQIEQATQRYKTVAAYLGESTNEDLAESIIYPQGSIRHRTTIKPLTRDEFDVDLICYLARAGHLLPADALKLIGERLRESEVYRKMLQPLKRGWRLCYANEFHLDITPATDDPNHVGGILVPDRGMPGGKPSHPEGFAVWFDNIAAKQPRMLLLERERALAKADIEALPDFGGFKGPLRRCVQLFKRDRDVMFYDETEDVQKAAPISVIITTLAAHAYRDCIAQREYESELDLLRDVLAGMPNYIERRPVPGGFVYWVANPANTKENFAEKWNKHPERAQNFYAWQRRAMQNVFNLIQQIGLDQVIKALGQTVGSRLSQQVLTEYTERLGRVRMSGALHYGAAGLGAAASGSAGATVRPNTFFGAR